MHRLSYQERFRNRCIAIAVIIFFLAITGYNFFIKETSPSSKNQKQTEQTNGVEPQDSLQVKKAEPEDLNESKANTIKNDSVQKAEDDNEKLKNMQASIGAAVSPENPPAIDVIDSTHIKKQKNVFLAEKIDNMLRRFRPDYGVILVVDVKTNEIIAWGERKDDHVQSIPDYFVKNTFPAASLAKTVTIAAAMESNRYSLNTPIPFKGASHTLYKSQLRIPEVYTGPTIEMQDAYAKSSNAPLAIIGMNVGANRLRAAAKKFGYNMNFPDGIPAKANYNPPDTGYGLAETSCGFTEETTLPPLLAAAQVRAIVAKKPLEIPWAENLMPYAPQKRIALNVEPFTENTFYGLREAMIRTVTNGTAHKNISKRNMARKNVDALTIGGKTGSLDGKDPAGRYEWFMGFAQAKEDASKAIVVVVMQVHKEIRSQPATQVAALVMNYWAHQNLSK